MTDLKKGRAAGAYEGSLRAIIHALKYDGCRSLAVPLATFMKNQGSAVLAGCECAVPVPLHPSKQRDRGFNQAEELARHLGLPVVHGLKRVHATVPQAGLPRGQRHRNVKDAFASTRNALELRNKIVVLVDDVRTTGATLNACARTLGTVGVREVRGLTAALALTPRL